MPFLRNSPVPTGSFILFRDGTDNFARIANGHRIVRNVLYNNTSTTDDNIAADPPPPA